MQLETLSGSITELSYPSVPGEGDHWSLRFYTLFTSGKGDSLKIPGFYNGQNHIVRFQLPEAGEWSYASFTSEGSKAFDEGVILCSKSNEPCKSGLQIDPENRKRFVLNGTPSFIMSYEANWLWALETSFPGSGRVDAFLKMIKSHGFNSVLMNAFAHDCTWREGNTSPLDFGPPGIYPWGGDNSQPDFSCFNADYWNHMDEVVRAFEENGIILHLYFKVFNKMVNWPVQGSREEEEYFRYITARYQAFSCMLWDFSKESYYEPDMGNLTKLMTVVKDSDAYNRLRTAHDFPAYYAGEDAVKVLDFHTAQQHHNFYSTTLLEHSVHDWPYMNAEFGYECGPGGATDVTYGVGQTPQELINRGWEVVMGGAYPAYYYTNTAWDVIHEHENPPGYKFFEYMADYFRENNFNDLRPYQDYGLWRSSWALVKGDIRSPEEVIMFIYDHILVPELLSPKDYSCEWYNIYNGVKHNAEDTAEPCIDVKSYTIYTIPFHTPYAVLKLTKKTGEA